MQPDIVPSEVLRSKECEHNTKHVLHRVKLHLEKLFLILRSDGTREDVAVSTNKLRCKVIKTPS